jgi:hypothetical protein
VDSPLLCPAVHTNTNNNQLFTVVSKRPLGGIDNSHGKWVVAAPRWYSALIALDPNKLRVRVQMRYMHVDVLGLRRGQGCRNTIPEFS